MLYVLFYFASMSPDFSPGFSIQKRIQTGLLLLKKYVHACIQTLTTNLESQRTHWVLWIPVCLAVGISCYFSLSTEPTYSAWGITGGVLGLAVLLISGFLIRNTLICAGVWILFWGISGFFLAILRTHTVDPGMLRQATRPLWVTGVVEGIDHPASTKSLFQRIVFRLSDTNTSALVLPRKALITIKTACLPLLEGDTIRMKAILTPLPCPCFPGAHDPRQQFFFQGIGASGFAINTPKILHRDPSFLGKYRHHLTRKLHAFLPPPLGAMACGLVTGDKIALPQKVRQEFADSGLAHLLAIAGLHMSILSGLCFMVFQRTLSRIPSLALHVNLDRIAAFLSLCVGWFYLMISGQRYPVQRAFFMMAASMLGMIVGRRRHSMRILMLCAMLFLILQPESLLSLSFQLSFAAVGGLIAVYQWRMERRYAQRRKPWKKKKWQALRRLCMDSLWSSGSITVMTLPIMVHHFYHVSLQGLISNMIAIPFTAVCVMPIGLMALLFLATPWAWVVMGLWGLSLQGLVIIAELSARYGSWLIGWFRPYDTVFFAFEMLGICWILLWHNRWRWYGLIVWIGAMILGVYFRTNPTFLIDSDHKLAAYVDRARHTLWVSSLRRGKWAAQRWSQAFGVPKIQLWPLEKSQCAEVGLPWYGMHTQKDSASWTLDLGVQERVLRQNAMFGPKTGCQILDDAGRATHPDAGKRPWHIPGE